MEDKIFDLMSKMYWKLTDFRKEAKQGIKIQVIEGCRK
ncbi:hypothetical protein DFR58_1494 [Anaerobacterium chartisolvens]|uniref:Uncharacterized protein n=1 Tax=Anaerobacterium chartisolvens TaxID=1297424 RepID=A0A369AFB4_9FIRM|nr:hypothetical protein DFR58_1494 [Anaerobacterium chartisolvens]